MGAVAFCLDAPVYLENVNCNVSRFSRWRWVPNTSTQVNTSLRIGRKSGQRFGTGVLLSAQPSRCTQRVPYSLAKEYTLNQESVTLNPKP